MLKRVVDLIQTRYPSSLCESWDNVGLLVNMENSKINNIMLTNDITKEVMNDAVDKKCDLIICYHPVIFKGIKSFNLREPKSSLLAIAIKNNLSIYCPHTSMDNSPGSINDWLASCFDKYEIKTSNYIVGLNNFQKEYPFYCEIEEKEENLNYENIYENISKFMYPPYHYYIKLEKKLYVFFKYQQDFYTFDNYFPFKSIIKNSINLISHVGCGRIITLNNKISLKDAVSTLKIFLNVPFVNVAKNNRNYEEKFITKIALCPGSGGDMFNSVDADLFVTGELLHHNALYLNEKGASVITTFHSNCERGYLKVFSEELKTILSQAGLENKNIVFSEFDIDPYEHI